MLLLLLLLYTRNRAQKQKQLTDDVSCREQTKRLYASQEQGVMSWSLTEITTWARTPQQQGGI